MICFVTNRLGLSLSYPKKVLSLLGDSGMVTTGYNELPEADIYVRWGFCGKMETDARVINTPEGIRNANNKRQARMILQKAGVPIPETWFDVNDARWPCIIRPNHHTGGKMFIVINSKNTFKMWSKRGRLAKRFYYSEIFPKKREFRVSISNYTIIGMTEKKVVKGKINCNSRVTGHPPRVVDIDYKLCGVAVEACKALGIESAGVDVFVDKKGYAVVGEVNACPMIRLPEIAENYVWHYKELLRDEKLKALRS